MCIYDYMNVYIYIYIISNNIIGRACDDPEKPIWKIRVYIRIKIEEIKSAYHNKRLLVHTWFDCLESLQFDRDILTRASGFYRYYKSNASYDPRRGLQRNCFSTLSLLSAKHTSILGPSRFLRIIDSGQ